jgi:hypothetical protein
MAVTRREAIFKTITNLTNLSEWLINRNSTIWKQKDGMIECTYCHRLGSTIQEISHSKGAKAGEVLNDAINIFDVPPCPVVGMHQTIKEAKELLALLKETSDEPVKQRRTRRKKV